MPGLKTNERPGTRAVLRHCRMSATKARQVLDLVRDAEVERAAEILRTTPREAAVIVGKLLASAVANAMHNDGMDPDDLYVSACYADEAGTLKRWRPRARGRATRIRKRGCHITIIVSRLPEERLARRRAEREAAGGQRARRVAESRRRADLAGRLARRRAAQAEAAAREEEQEELAEDLEETSTGSAGAGAGAGGETAEAAEAEEVGAPEDDEDALAEDSADDVAGAGGDDEEKDE